MTVTAATPTEASPARGPSQPRRRRGGRAGTGSVPLRGLLPLAVGLATWQVAGGSEPYFPPPGDWWTAVREVMHTGLFWPAVRATLYSFLISLAVATVIGVVLGYAVGRSRTVDRLLNPLLEFLRFTPSSAMLPIIVLLIGYEQKMKVLVVVLGAIWPILLQTRAAARALNPAQLDLAVSLHMTPLTRLRKIIFPLLLPAILLGIRIATPTALILVLLVEITTNVPGLGQLLTQAQANFVTAQVYGLVSVAALLALLVNSVIMLIESYLLRYRPRA